MNDEYLIDGKILGAWIRQLHECTSVEIDALDFVGVPEHERSAILLAKVKNNVLRVVQEMDMLRK